MNWWIRGFIFWCHEQVSCVMIHLHNMVKKMVFLLDMLSIVAKLCNLMTVVENCVNYLFPRKQCVKIWKTLPAECFWWSELRHPVIPSLSVVPALHGKNLLQSYQLVNWFFLSILALFRYFGRFIHVIHRVFCFCRPWPTKPRWGFWAWRATLKRMSEC